MTITVQPWRLMWMVGVCRKVHRQRRARTTSKEWSCQNTGPDLVGRLTSAETEAPSLISGRDNGSNWHQAETFQSVAPTPRQTTEVTLLRSRSLVLAAPLLLQPLRISSVTGRPSAFVPLFEVQREHELEVGAVLRSNPVNVKISMVVLPNYNW